MRAPLNTCSCRFPLTPPWALIAGTKHQKHRRSSVKDTPADTDAHTHKHNGSRGRPRGGVGGEAKYSLSAGFSRIKASLLRAATVHFLPVGREKNGPEGRARSPWLPCPQIMASVQRWGHSQRKWQLPPSYPRQGGANGLISFPQEMLLCWWHYIIFNCQFCGCGVNRGMQAACMKIAGHIVTVQKVNKASERRSIIKISFLQSSLFSQSQQGVTAITFCLFSWNLGSRRRLVSFRIPFGWEIILKKRKQADMWRDLWICKTRGQKVKFPEY